MNAWRSVGAEPNWVDVLTDDECWTLLRATGVARLAVDIAGEPDIFPINYVVSGTTIVFRTAEGTKLAGAVLGRAIALEIDGVSPSDRSVWSVVVKGAAHEITNMFERYAADDLPLYPWTGSPKYSYVRIESELVTGRRFHVLDTADLDAYVAQVSGAATAAPADRPAPFAVVPEPGAVYHRDAPQLRPD